MDTAGAPAGCRCVNCNSNTMCPLAGMCPSCGASGCNLCQCSCLCAGCANYESPAQEAAEDALETPDQEAAEQAQMGIGKRLSGLNESMKKLGSVIEGME